MRKISKLPREELTPTDSDGLPVRDDTEGHRAKSGPSLLPGMPGTGGDEAAPRRPWGVGENQPTEDDDTEGHARGGEHLIPSLPGTGGDSAAPRRPWGVGENTGEDDTEGHRIV